MVRTYSLKTAVAGFVAAGALALGATAQAMTIESGLGATGAGTAANPFVVTVSKNQSPGLFLDTINFDLGTDTHFNMTSSVNGIQFFGVPIFENGGDTQAVPGATTFTNQPLADLGLSPFDYHLHPQGSLPTGVGSYTLTLWGSTLGGPGVPIPGAVWLFGTGVAGLAGLARRKMMAKA